MRDIKTGSIHCLSPLVGSGEWYWGTDYTSGDLYEAEELSYNLMPHMSPLCLTRQTAERFQMIWPEKADFAIHPAETFCFREGNWLYFSRWYEDPVYREEVIVRRMPDGEVLSSFRGSILEMPDGQQWLLTE